MKAYQQVARHIEQGVLSGTYPVGTVLPPEREMASQLGVSRAAVREAIRTLEARGVLDSSVGAGPSSGTRVISQHTQALVGVLKLHVALGRFPVADIVDTRILLERRAVKDAAENSDNKSLDQIANALRTMASTRSIETFNRWDTQFHVAIAKVSNNKLNTDLTQAVRESLMKPIELASRQMGNDAWQDFRLSLMEQHEEVFTLIKEHKPTRAADAIEHHIRTSYEILPFVEIKPPQPENPQDSASDPLETSF